MANKHGSVDIKTNDGHIIKYSLYILYNNSNVIKTMIDDNTTPNDTLALDAPKAAIEHILKAIDPFADAISEDYSYSVLMAIHQYEFTSLYNYFDHIYDQPMTNEYYKLLLAINKWDPVKVWPMLFKCNKPINYISNEHLAELYKGLTLARIENYILDSKALYSYKIGWAINNIPNFVDHLIKELYWKNQVIERAVNLILVSYEFSPEIISLVKKRSYESLPQIDKEQVNNVKKQKKDNQ
jgi:hypothetical protein